MPELPNPALGAWTALNSIVAVEELSRQGFDYVCVDGQHGLLDYGEIRDALIAITAAGAAAGAGVAAGGPVPLVRVSENNAAEIGRMLDAGAQGVIVPLIESAADAEAAARAVRYPVSGGARSWGPFRHGAHFAGSPAETDAGVTLLVMIETVGALEDVEAILEVPGVDGVYVGPYDLSLALGARVPFEDAILPRLDEALARVRRAARDRGKIAGVHCADGRQARARIEQGFTMATAATDISVLCSGMRAQLEAARG